ncbi:MAG TPA: TonB-dependent receptor, partial [Bacteroidia bacterium]|nr:TonB-dependent receptor [Bacteroidia bacterium]
MSRNLLLFFLLFNSFRAFSQAPDLRLRGNVSDSSQTGGVPNVLLMAIRFSDSTLVNFTRSNNKGFFTPIKIPVDTYLVILSHPAFSDKTYLLVPSKKDTAYNFKNVVLPPKTVVLNEVEIIAYKDKSYYKGDTLIFTADSFKTAPNATVEDLLKKLPGVRVDSKGKITIQGKEVDQVLVDGDEFFGSDPTVATRNLNAASIENVQVYDKKNESTAEGQNETLKIVNLKMKEDAKKGYFGKVSGASDFQKFYENELLANRFKGGIKLSVFGIVANTPKQAFDWNETDKYGLSNEQPWSYNEETGNWTQNSANGTGIPQTLKTGFYFNDKISKNTKINTDYTFNQNQLESGSETNTQFFLEDTSYTNKQVTNKIAKNQTHNFNFRLVQKLDSLTELTVVPKLKYAVVENSGIQTDGFISEENVLTRETRIANNNRTESTDANVLLRLNRNFMKKDRTLALSYQPIYNTGSNVTRLNSDFSYYQGQLADSSSMQKRSQENYKLEHNATMIYVEPLSKKFKTEVNYNFAYTESNNNRQTYTFGGSAYDIFNPVLSNNFDNNRVIHRTGAKLIYEVKKYKISIGSNFRNVHQENLNVTTGQKMSLDVNNVLPLASFNYRINQGSNLQIYYNTSSQQPDLQQMQPVIDNTDPNRITIGNPNLKPTFNNNASLNYYFYKGISDVNFYSGFNAGAVSRQISYATSYDSLGKAVSQPVNINGNYNSSFYLGGGFPVFKRFMKIYYSLNGEHSNSVSM